MSQLVKAVFGSLNGRARVLLMGWNTNFVPFGIQEDKVYPWLESQYGAMKDWLWGIGGAPYPEAESDDSTTADVRNSVEAQLTLFEQYFHRVTWLTRKLGLKHVQYEGNIDMHALGTNFTLIDAMMTSSDGRTAQSNILNRVLGFGIDLHMLFQSSMAFTNTKGDQAWGVARTLAADGGAIGSATSERLKGIDDVLLGARPPNLDPNELPGTLKFQGGTGYKDNLGNTFVTNGMRTMYNQGSILECGFYASSSGAINLTIWGGCVAGTPPNGVRIYLNGALQGSLDLASTTNLNSMPSGGSASPTAFALAIPAIGYYALKLAPPDNATVPSMGVSKVVGA